MHSVHGNAYYIDDNAPSKSTGSNANDQTRGELISWAELSDRTSIKYRIYSVHAKCALLFFIIICCYNVWTSSETWTVDDALPANDNDPDPNTSNMSEIVDCIGDGSAEVFWQMTNALLRNNIRIKNICISYCFNGTSELIQL
ncbi:hypothetical protein GJ496_007067 [Pomphorhynchus laevis]|nr:hypothetical protein GJ496_007067 [Pomphorhynchus laevis]